MIWHWLEGKREDLAPFSSPRGNLPAREAGDLLHHGTSRVSSIYKSRPTSSPICGRSHCLFVRRLGDAPALLLLLLVGATERPSSSCSWKHSCGDAGAERDACNDDEEGRRCTATAQPRPCAISCSAVRRQVSEQQRAMVPWMAPSRWSRNRLQGLYSI